MATVGAVAMGIATKIAAAPRTPDKDSDVLERLGPAFLAIRRVKPDGPGQLPVEQALATARRYIEVGQTYADPRAYGFAQAALGRWWSADPAPTEVLVMRARILQFRHEFAAALAQLEPALRSDQFDPDAWLLFATIAQVQGNVRAARAACLKLIPISDPLIGATCTASTAMLSGNAAGAKALVIRALADATSATPAERTWAWSMLGDICAIDQDGPGAVSAYEHALEISPADVYARSAYADLLLDKGDTSAARRVLGEDVVRADALLLRAAIASARDSGPDAPMLRATLAQRFAEARERGDDSHLREQARFALEVEHDVRTALVLAQRNFSVQREPADARILLEAARAAGDRDAARPALDWLKKTGFRSSRLLELAQLSPGGPIP